MARGVNYRACEACGHPGHYTVELQPELADKWKREPEGRRFRFWRLGWRLGEHAQKVHGKRAQVEIGSKQVYQKATDVLDEHRMHPHDKSSRLYLCHWAYMGYTQWFVYRGDFEAAVRQEHILEWKCKEASKWRRTRRPKKST